VSISIINKKEQGIHLSVRGEGGTAHSQKKKKTMCTMFS